MVQAMDQDAVEGDMDQEAVEGAVARPYALVVFYSHIHMACRCGQELVA